MRRMRDIWYYFLFAVPVVAAVLGVRYFIQKSYENNSGFSVMKPSLYRGEVAKVDAEKTQLTTNSGTMDGSAMSKNSTSKPGKSRLPASTSKKDAAKSAAKDNSKETGKDAAKSGLAAAAAALQAMANSGPLGAPVPAPSASAAASNQADGKDQFPAIVETIEERKIAADGSCRSFEYRGDSPEHVFLDKTDWTQVMDQFHEVKADLLSWLERRKDYFQPKTFELMSNQVKNLRIQRPPTLEEPDLSWRGVGVFTHTAGGQVLLRLGGGFTHLSKTDAPRAKFELARLISQAWAPCEVKKQNGGEPWKELMGCLKVSEEQGCATGTYSESGWAVSSVVAWMTEPPGCTLPALKDPQMASCLNGLSPKAAPAQTPTARRSGKTWKEARR